MNSRQVSDDEEDEPRFSRFQNEKEQQQERVYKQRRRDDQRQQTQDWVDEGATAEEAEVEEEVAVEPVIRPKNPAMFKTTHFDGFKAPRLPRHRVLTGRNSPPPPPLPQVPSSHDRGENCQYVILPQSQ